MSFSAIAVDLMLPPVGLAFLAFLALALVGGRSRGARALAVLSLGALLLMAMPIVSMTALASLDPGPAGPDGPGAVAPQAIVILSADVQRTGGVEPTDLGAMTLERERAGAALYRKTKLPVLVTGGIVMEPPPVAVLMANSMRDDFGVPVRWVEPRSATTWENAQFSAPMLKEAGIGRVYVVTHAWHMRRSLLAFRRAGLDPVAASVLTDPWPRGELKELMPRVSSWQRSYFALHEWVGILYYAWRG